jgi:hypothetical protein
MDGTDLTFGIKWLALIVEKIEASPWIEGAVLEEV